jgi:hypothetical protein
MDGRRVAWDFRDRRRNCARGQPVTRTGTPRNDSVTSSRSASTTPRANQRPAAGRRGAEQAYGRPRDEASATKRMLRPRGSGLRLASTSTASSPSRVCSYLAAMGGEVSVRRWSSSSDRLPAAASRSTQPISTTTTPKASRWTCWRTHTPCRRAPHTPARDGGVDLPDHVARPA